METNRINLYNKSIRIKVNEGVEIINLDDPYIYSIYNSSNDIEEFCLTIQDIIEAHGECFENKKNFECSKMLSIEKPNDPLVIGKFIFQSEKNTYQVFLHNEDVEKTINLSVMKDAFQEENDSFAFIKVIQPTHSFKISTRMQPKSRLVIYIYPIEKKSHDLAMQSLKTSK